ncbi:DUF6707 family protein [Pseudarthrobacter sp. J1738]|uniref:DUF6707 family protein n=1 Tax=unclassified Pseudarthrobacter TaxID=2647000 RepID=UPI003D2E54D5
MNRSQSTVQYREEQAGTLQSGDRLLLPDGQRSAEISLVEAESDDFGNPALIVITLVDGYVLRLAANASAHVAHADIVQPPAGSRWSDILLPRAKASTEPTATTGLTEVPPTSDAEPAVSAVVVPSEGGDSAEVPAAGLAAAVPAATPAVLPPAPENPPAIALPDEAELALIPEPEGTPESVVERVAAEYPGRPGVQALASRLAKGINLKSGSCLTDLRDLAHELYIEHSDSASALAIADLLNVLPFDGNPGRWSAVEASLSLSSFLCSKDGQDERSELYRRLLRAPEAQESDPFKARIAAKVRQRALNEPNLYDKEIFRSIDNGNHEAEREWRVLRLESLLYLRAHGGSESISAGELNRRIDNELEAIRA